MKKRSMFISISIFGSLLGIWLSKLFTARYGINGRIIIVAIAALISIFAVLGMVFMKKYFEAIVGLAMASPGIVIFVGIYLDNIYLAGLGILLVIIIFPIMIKLIPKYRNNKKQ